MLPEESTDLVPLKRTSWYVRPYEAKGTRLGLKMMKLNQSSLRSKPGPVMTLIIMRLFWMVD